MTREVFFGLKIVNRARFIAFISIVIISISFMVNSLVPQTTVSGQTEIKYIQVTVEPGDTLWEIAMKYNKNGKDVRKFIYDIMKENNLKNSGLYEGQLINIPVK